jgi:hypothetical protein
MQFAERFPQLSMVAVAGNCDYGNYAPERFLAISPCVDSGEEAVAKILLTHGQGLGVKSGLDRLVYYAREKGADACFYGHTHFPVCATVGGVLLFNPGSPSFPRGGSNASYGIVEILPDGEILGRLMPI